jgi:hypothetical protein
MQRAPGVAGGVSLYDNERPSLTIEALAIRAGRYIREQLAARSL